MPTAEAMTQDERRQWLIEALLAERAEPSDPAIPASAEDQRLLLRALFNVRPPLRVTDEFLAVQDAYLQERAREKGIVDVSDLEPVAHTGELQGIYLWQGDITRLAAGAIVNAANSQMLGCFVPNHGCIDNAIHTYAGVELRLACAELMGAQGHEEPTGAAKITPGFNLPAEHVIHTVGPIVSSWDGRPTPAQEEQLASCYRSSLAMADEAGCSAIAFCCISTGEFHFPNKLAATIARATVLNYRRETGSSLEVIFNVFKQLDYDIYRELLGIA